MSESIFDNIWIVLYEPIYEINIGYMARCMKNFSLRNLFLVNPITIIGSTAFKYASKANDILENVKIVDSIKKIFDETDFIVGTTGKVGGPRNIVRRSVSPEVFAKNVGKINGIVSIIFGREDIGLPNNILAQCDIIINIKTDPKYSILNISHAAAIIFYEIFKYYKPRKIKKISSEYQLKILERKISSILEEINLSERERIRAKLVFKRVLGRAFLQKDEIGVLLNMFKKIERKIMK